MVQAEPGVAGPSHAAPGEGSSTVNNHSANVLRVVAVNADVVSTSGNNPVWKSLMIRWRKPVR